MIILGIDPGSSGGLACIRRSTVTAEKMPQTPRDVWDWMRFWSDIVEDCGDPEFGMPIHAFLELVHAMPKQGVSSTFKFGQNFGMLEGFLVAASIPYELVTPGVWQRALGCLSRGDKNVTKKKAQQLFPSMKVTHATADALLIAEYGRRQRQGTTTTGDTR